MLEPLPADDMDHPVDRTKYLDGLCESPIDVRPHTNIGENAVEASAAICGCRFGDGQRFGFDVDTDDVGTQLSCRPADGCPNTPAAGAGNDNRAIVQPQSTSDHGLI
jgi:hypothetical protein